MGRQHAGPDMPDEDNSREGRFEAHSGISLTLADELARLVRRHELSIHFKTISGGSGKSALTPTVARARSDASGASTSDGIACDQHPEGPQVLAVEPPMLSSLAHPRARLLSSYALQPQRGQRPLPGDRAGRYIDPAVLMSDPTSEAEEGMEKTRVHPIETIAWQLLKATEVELLQRRLQASLNSTRELVPTNCHPEGP